MPKAPGTTTTMTTMTTEPGDAALLRLISFASPGFPTGGFAYSHGLEAAVDARMITDSATLHAWLMALMQYGTPRTDAILLRQAHRAARDPVALAQLARLANAACLGAERQLETLAQGAAFAAAVSPWCTVENAAYPVVFGAAAGLLNITENAACIGLLTGFINNLISAALRLGQIGQAAGLRILHALEPHVCGLAQTTKDASLDDIGTSCFMADIFAMQHESQYARMFRS